jgi:cholesterol oxidase
MTEFDFDFAIIGSGFGGSVSALRLSEKGYSVAVLEMGKRWTNGGLSQDQLGPAQILLWRPRLGLYGIMQLTVLRDVFILHGCGVGGGSLVYANTLLVPPERRSRPAVGRAGLAAGAPPALRHGLADARRHAERGASSRPIGC